MTNSTKIVVSSGRKPGRPTLSNEAMLDRALDIFLELGFERTTIDAIASLAGVAKRTLYLRYEDKNNLFKAALERAINEWIIPVEILRAAETEDLEETLLRVGRILLNNILSPAGLRLLRITNAESARMPAIGAYTNQKGTEPTLIYLADLLRRRVKSPHADIQNFDRAALTFLHLVVGGPAWLNAWGVELDAKAIDDHTSYCVRLYLYGLMPSPPPAEPSELEAENKRLRGLLVETMLEAVRLMEKISRGQGKTISSTDGDH